MSDHLAGCAQMVERGYDHGTGSPTMTVRYECADGCPVFEARVAALPAIEQCEWCGGPVLVSVGVCDQCGVAETA